MLSRCATLQTPGQASPEDGPNDVCAQLSQLGLRSGTSVTQTASSHLSSAGDEFPPIGSSFPVRGGHWLVAVNIQKDVLSLG